MASSSSGVECVPGTRPCRERCRIVREVEKPTAPARTRLLGESRHLGDLVVAQIEVVRALAEHVGAQRAVRHLRGDVEHARHRRERVEVLGERLPTPVDALVQRGAGDVLDALHQLDEEVLLAAPHRREADAAVAHHQRSSRRASSTAPGAGPR